MSASAASAQQQTVDRVSGSGVFDNGSLSFSVDALKSDGKVTGTWHSEYGSRIVTADVTCLEVSGSRAVIGGVIVSSTESGTSNRFAPAGQ
jgi:hypothetical protein